MRNLCVIMRGAPASGKTTLAEKLYSSRKPKVCSADHFFEYPVVDPLEWPVRGESEYVFDAKRLPQAHTDCLTKFMAAIIDEHPCVVVDNNNTQLWELTCYLELARAYGYVTEINAVVPRTMADLKLICARNSQRPAGRSVPREILVARALDFEPTADYVEHYYSVQGDPIGKPDHLL